MIKLGTVKSINKVSSKSIVSVVLDQSYDDLSLTDVSVVFGEDGEPIQLEGFKWWFEQMELDLMFDSNFELPDIGSATFIISSMQLGV